MEPEWHPDAALGFLIFMSLLFAAVGLANVELSFFGFPIASQIGIVWWVVISLSFALLFGYLLHRQRSK